MRVRVCDLKEDDAFTKLRWTEKHAAAAYADEAVRFLNEMPTDQPFFLYVPFDGPHDPHIVPDDFPITYEPADIPLPPNFMPIHPFDNGEMKIRDERLLPHPRTPRGHSPDAGRVLAVGILYRRPGWPHSRRVGGIAARGQHDCRVRL